jgi:hypothetical protein
MVLKQDGIGEGARHIPRIVQFARVNMRKPLEVPSRVSLVALQVSHPKSHELLKKR